MQHKTVKNLVTRRASHFLSQSTGSAEGYTWTRLLIFISYPPLKVHTAQNQTLLNLGGRLCPLVPTWPEVCSADARTMPLPVRGFPTQQLSPMYLATPILQSPQSFKGHKPMEKGISQNEHSIGSQNTNLKNNRPFVCLCSISSCILTQNICTIRKLLVCANYNELTHHGKIHKTTDKSESTCYLTHVVYSIQDQRAAREWNMRARCQLEHAGF